MALFRPNNQTYLDITSSRYSYQNGSRNCCDKPCKIEYTNGCCLANNVCFAKTCEEMRNCRPGGCRDLCDGPNKFRIDHRGCKLPTSERFKTHCVFPCLEAENLCAVRLAERHSQHPFIPCVKIDCLGPINLFSRPRRKETACLLKEVFPSSFRTPKTLQPNWLKFNKLVLTFYGYFQESICESPLENYRIHACAIHYYPENDTIEVSELRTFDPGYVQGRLINRGRIPLPPPDRNSYYTLDHLNVGCEVEFYGKIFKICSCNDTTRAFLNKTGVPVPHNMEMPWDPATLIRLDRHNSRFPNIAHPDKREACKGMKYYENYKLVLRFWGYWDDRCNEDGRLHQFVIHYFLEDDTMEILERFEPNSGCVYWPVFLNRSKVPKDMRDLVGIVGMKEEAILILNTKKEEDWNFTLTYMEDKLCPGVEEKETYKPCDFAIGAVLNIYGRAVMITECDPFTEVYMREKFGMEDFTPLELMDECCSDVTIESPLLCDCQTPNGPIC